MQAAIIHLVNRLFWALADPSNLGIGLPQTIIRLCRQLTNHAAQAMPALQAADLPGPASALDPRILSPEPLWMSTLSDQAGAGCTERVKTEPGLGRPSLGEDDIVLLDPNLKIRQTSTGWLIKLVEGIQQILVVV